MRHPLRTGLLFLLGLVVFASTGLAQDSARFVGVFLTDRTGNMRVGVTNDGKLMVDAAVAVENIAHITSALHVAGIASTVNVNCLAGCSGAAAGAHTAVTQAGLPWTVLAHQGGSWTLAATQSGAWSVATSGHQAATQAGAWTVTANAGSGTFTVAGAVSQSGAWGVNVGHVSAALHVAGIASTVSVNCIAGCSASSATHTAVTQAAAPWTVAHISAQVHVAGIVPTREHVSGGLRAWQVNACGTTASLAVASNPLRRDLIIQNLGGPANADRIILYVGYGATGHVALTSANGMPLGVHRTVLGTAAVPTQIATTPPLRFENYQGPLACITSASTAIMSVVEILK